MKRILDPKPATTFLAILHPIVPLAVGFVSHRLGSGVLETCIYAVCAWVVYFLFAGSLTHRLEMNPDVASSARRLREEFGVKTRVSKDGADASGEGGIAEKRAFLNVAYSKQAIEVSQVPNFRSGFGNIRIPWSVAERVFLRGEKICIELAGYRGLVLDLPAPGARKVGEIARIIDLERSVVEG